MRKLNTIISKDTCLFYGLPGTAILAMSLVLSRKVANDFGGSTFVNEVSFIGCNLLLWLLYLLLFQYLPEELMDMWASRKEYVVINTDKSDSTTRTDSLPSVNSQPITTEVYQANCAEFERKKQEEHQKLVNPIIDYVSRMMSPFMDESELDLLRNEITAWCYKPNYEPKSVRLKTVHDNKDRLKTVSFKHLVWNIAARLGSENGYTIKTQAKFIKGLFPNELADIELNSLAKSLTCYPNEGHIKLDRPVHTDNYVFHF